MSQIDVFLYASTNRHAREALALVGLVVEGPGRTGVAEEGGGVEDVAVLEDTRRDGGLVGEERERVRRARRADVVAFKSLVGAGAAADTLGEVRSARLEAGRAHVRAGAVASALEEVGGARADVGAGGARRRGRVLREGGAGGVAEGWFVGVVGARRAGGGKRRLARDAEACRCAGGGGRRGVVVGPADRAGCLIQVAVAPVRARPAGAAGRVEVAGVAEARRGADSTRHRVGAGGARVADAAELVGPGRAQRARAAGRAAEAGVAETIRRVCRRW
jgi:hypothetical protein